MPLVHSFRLRDPWQCRCGADGGAVWSRGFHRPTGLDAGDELWLIIAELPAGAAVSINGVAVQSTGESPGGPFRVHDVVGVQLNQLEVTLPAPPPDDGLFPYDAQLGVVTP